MMTVVFMLYLFCYLEVIRAAGGAGILLADRVTEEGMVLDI